MSNIEKLLEKRKKMMDTVFRNEQPERVPVTCGVSTWAYYYKGYKPKDGLENPEITEEVYRAVYKDFYFDSLDTSGPVTPYHPKINEILGGGTFTFNQEGLHQTNPGSINVMSPEEYPELIKDPYEFMINKVFPRRYKLFRDYDPETKYRELCKMMNIRKKLLKQIERHNEIAEKEFALPSTVQGLLYAPIDYILDYLRDFAGIMSDIKRRPELVRDAGLALVQFNIDRIAGITPKAGTTVFIPMHLPTFLNPRDFEKVYWPSYKKLIYILVEKGFIVKCAFERKYEHLFDFLQELPKNRIVGMALAARLDGRKNRVFTLMGDGETQEGTVWEAAMAAANFKLGNLVAFVDRNRLSLDGETEKIMKLEPYADKWKAFGWNVVEVDGHSIEELVDAMDNLPSVDSDVPTVVIAHTIKGKGVPSMENDFNWHAGSIDDEFLKKACAEIDEARKKERGE